MIEVNELHRRFGRVLAVDGLSFNAAPGEVLGFLGPNGAGKTTTMRIICGFLAASSGTVRIYGQDVRTAGVAARARIGYLPEGAPLYGEMTPRQLLHFAVRVRGMADERVRARTAFAIDRLSIGEVIDVRIETLSKGFRRRVALAVAIVHDPDVLILDEPTDGLDPNQKHEVRGLIRELSNQRIIIISTHVLEEVDAVCTRALIIGNGRLLADASPRQLAQRSRYHGAVTIAFKTVPADIEVLSDISAPSGIEQQLTGAAATVTVFPLQQARADGRTLFEVIRQIAAERRWQIEGLYVEPGRLDDVFRALTNPVQGRAA